MKLYETKIAEEKLIIKCCGVLIYSIPLLDITQISKEGNLVTIKTEDWGVTMNKETMMPDEIWRELVY